MTAGHDRTDASDASIHLFYGDEFLVKEEVRKIVDGFIDPKLLHTNLITLDGANLDVSELSAMLFTPSLFGGNRIVLVEQTPMFMGKADQGKLAAKAADAWRRNDRKAAFKALGQLFSLAGISKSDIESDASWVDDLVGGAQSTDTAEALTRAARAFVESGETIGSSGDEGLPEEILSGAFPEGTKLIMTAPAVDKRKKFFKAFEAAARVVECVGRRERFGGGLDRSFFDERVRGAVERAGKRIEPRALDAVYSRAGNDLRRLHGEVDKLVGYVGERTSVTVSDVEAVFTDFREAAFFELNNALRTRDPAVCLPALHENLKIVAHPLQTLGAIATEFRRLMVARELLFTVFKPHWSAGMTYQRFRPIAKKVRDEHPPSKSKTKHDLLSMKDYPLYLYLRDAQKFTLEKLISVLEAVLEADMTLKSSRLGSTAPDAVMEDLVLKICAPDPSAKGASQFGAGRRGARPPV